MKHCALITGASSGIGEALAYELARKGYNLYLIARRENRLMGVCEAARELGVEVVYRKVDLLNETERNELCNDVIHNHELDMLVNNAGFGEHGWFTQIERSRQLHMIETNVTALVDLTHQLLRHMERKVNKEDNESSLNRFVVNIASVAGFQPGAWYATYYASKAFVLSFSESLSEEYRYKWKMNHDADTPRIHVSAVCPGPTQSEFFTNAGMRLDDKSFVVMLFKHSPTSEALAKYVVRCVLNKQVVIVHGKLFKALIFIQRFMSRRTVRMLSSITQKTRLQ